MTNKRKAKRGGPFAAGPDARRHQWTAETRPDGVPFAKGHDERRNPGGRPQAARDLVAFAQEMAPDVQARLKKMLASDDDEVAQYAIDYLTKWGMGAPPKKPRTVVPASATVEQLEELLTEEAFEGDRAAVLALLAAKDPARYGKQTRKGEGEEAGDGDDTDVPGWTPMVQSQ